MNCVRLWIQSRQAEPSIIRKDLYGGQEDCGEVPTGGEQNAKTDCKSTNSAQTCNKRHDQYGAPHPAQVLEGPNIQCIPQFTQSDVNVAKVYLRESLRDSDEDLEARMDGQGDQLGRIRAATRTRIELFSAPSRRVSGPLSGLATYGSKAIPNEGLIIDVDTPDYI
jgi:hypothetical protein